MIRRILTIEDLKSELERYFDIMPLLPSVKKPTWRQNSLARLIPSEWNAEDYEIAALKKDYTRVDVADVWYMDANWLSLVSKDDYRLLWRMFRGHPRKVIAYDMHIDESTLYRRYEKAINKIFNTIRVL